MICNVYRKNKVCDLFKNGSFSIVQNISEGKTKLFRKKKGDILKQYNVSQKPEPGYVAECAIVIDLPIIVKAKADSLCSMFDEFAVVVALQIKSLAKK